LRKLDHPYICRLLEVFTGTKHTYLVMEFVQGEELFEYITRQVRLDGNFAQHVMRQVFEALNYCHGLGVIHRDLKPENIMVTQSSSSSSMLPPSEVEVKLIDFGLAEITNTLKGKGTQQPSAMVGTYSYLPPEVLRGSRASPASDMWSAGMVLHALLLGCLPIDEVRIGQVPLDVQHQDYALLSADVKALLTKLLHLNELQRLTADEAVRIAGSLTLKRNSHHGSMGSLTSSFQNFHRSQMLRKAVLTAVAMQCVTNKIDGLREKFLSADENGDGRVSKAELAASISTEDVAGLFGDNVGLDVGKWIDQVFDSIDTDGSHSIEYTEWVAAALQEGSVRCEQSILAAFRSFDTDNSGKISTQEFRHVVQGSCTDIERLMPRFDRNGDGEIDLEEFQHIILDTPNDGSRPEDSKSTLTTGNAIATNGTDDPAAGPAAAPDNHHANAQMHAPSAGAGYGQQPTEPQVRQREGTSMGNCCFCGT